MKAVNSVFVGFRCPRELKDSMVAFADSKGVDLSQLVRSAVRAELTKYEDTVLPHVKSTSNWQIKQKSKSY